MKDDKELLAELITGSHAAFRALSERYGRALYVFAVRILGDGFLAEDIVQDAFETLWNTRQRLDAALSVRSYIYGIVRNRCMAEVRSGQIADRYRNAVPQQNEDIMSQYIETETMRLLLEAIETLPPRSAEVIRLSLDGLRQDEIAHRMGIALVTVKVLKSEGLKKLRRMLPAATFLLLSL